jgi:hypothetical protein
MLRVGVLIDLPPGLAYRVATLAAVEHAAHALGVAATACVLRTRAIPTTLANTRRSSLGQAHPTKTLTPSTVRSRRRASVAFRWSALEEASSMFW